MVARQGDMVIFADAMQVEYESKGKLKEIEAQGGVKIIQADRIATGDLLRFTMSSKKSSSRETRACGRVTTSLPGRK